MRERITSMLRKAGDKVRDFDDAYAGKVAEYIASFKPEQGSKAQVAQVLASIGAGAPATRKFAVEDESRVLRDLIGYGVPALNAGVRYGVPALGAVGIADVIGNVYDAASQVPVLGNNPN